MERWKVTKILDTRWDARENELNKALASCKMLSDRYLEITKALTRHYDHITYVLRLRRAI